MFVDSPLQVGMASAISSLAKEQASLVHDLYDGAGAGSKVDVLVCTPGRLMEHIAGTPGFTLRDLRFVVIDEADRLLARDFTSWIVPLCQAVDDQRRVVFH
jgi:ATP-dependent RNA helicase DDX51/DBP6